MRILAVWMLLAGNLLFGESVNQLTLLLQFDGHPSKASLAALDLELKSIMAASQFPVRLNVRTTPLNGEVPGDLVVFKMKGSCSMEALPVAAVSDERGPLAMTHMVNGEMLPFADVECDRVRNSVRRTVGLGNPHLHQTQFGMALARVMAHELYHMLAKSSVHSATGLAKSALSSRELSTGTMRLLVPMGRIASPQE